MAIDPVLVNTMSGVPRVLAIVVAWKANITPIWLCKEKANCQYRPLALLLCNTYNGYDCFYPIPKKKLKEKRGAGTRHTSRTYIHQRKAFTYSCASTSYCKLHVAEYYMNILIRPCIGAK